MAKKDLKYRIVKMSEPAPRIFRAILKSENSENVNAAPGQFAMIKVSENLDPLLRRPISYLHANGDEIELLFRVVGAGTKILSQTPAGTVLDVLGPLGNGFDLSLAKNNAIIVAGGIGIAPIYFLARKLKAAGVKNVDLYFGACTAAELVTADELEKHGVRVHRATDDCSIGEQATASAIAIEALAFGKPDVIYTCGPHPMMLAVAVEAARLGVPCRASVEARMACGVGACLGCTVETSRGYENVCKTGPVFDSKILFKL